MTVAKRKPRKKKEVKTIRRPVVAPRRSSYVATPCSACEALRPKVDGTDVPQNYSITQATAQAVRYLKCRFCGRTWTEAITPENRPDRKAK